MTLEQLTQSFQEHCDPVKAEQMSAYMKHKFPFLGIASPERKQLSHLLVRDNQYKAESKLLSICKRLWKLKEREYQYVALDLLVRHKKGLTFSSINTLERFITTKAWWDSVDLLASHCVGQVYQSFPDEMLPVIAQWRRSPNMWLRRSCLLFQLKYKEHTNRDLLASIIRENKTDNEFFIQKAIGWSLREYAKTNPVWVKSFVDQEELVGLARREALKHFR